MDPQQQAMVSQLMSGQQQPNQQATGMFMPPSAGMSGMSFPSGVSLEFNQSANQNDILRQAQTMLRNGQISHDDYTRFITQFTPRSAGITP